MLPNTFVAGAQKSGTTTICTLLSMHPECILSSPKEPTFFCKRDNLDNIQLYESYFRQPDRNKPASCIIDGSTAYMVDPDVPGRIRDVLGDKLHFIFSLRRPADRTISAYWQMVKKGYEHRTIQDALMFESTVLADAIREEDEKITKAVKSGLLDLTAYIDRYDDPLWNFRYLRNSHYRPDLERYSTIFPRDRIKIVIFDDLAGDVRQVLRQIAKFLGLDPDLIHAAGQTHLNPARLPTGGYVSRKIISLLRTMPGRAIFRKLPGYSALYNLIYSRKLPPVDEKVITGISDLFIPEIDNLSVLIQRDLRLWT